MYEYPPRRAGVLLHLTSLPTDRDQGHLGIEAYHFIDFLASAGFRVWQVLPVNPVAGVDGSPYQCSSAFAGNPRMIDLQPLIEKGWLRADAREAVSENFRTAWRAFCRDADDEERRAFADFMDQQSYWLDDFALFHALHEEQGRGWWEWPEELRDRTDEGLAMARARLADQISCTRFVQFLFLASGGH